MRGPDSLQEIVKMKRMVKALMLSGAVAFGFGVNPVSAQHDHSGHDHGDKGHGEKAGHSHESAEGHGGAVTMSKEFHVETVFMPDQVRLYLYDGEQNPVHVKHWKKGLVEATGTVDYRDRGRGTTTLNFVRATPDGYACMMHPDQESTKPGKCPKCDMKLSKKDMPDGTLWSCPMHPDENGKGKGKCSDCGMKFTPQDYLVAAADLSGLKAGDAKVTFNLKNLPGENEQTLRFTEKFAPSEMHEEGKMHKGHKMGERGRGGDGHKGHDHDH
jgi:Heavy metal binding domain